MQKRGVHDADNLRGCPRGQCVTDAGWSSYILWAPRPSAVTKIGNLRGSPRGQCVTDAGRSSYILWAPRPERLSKLGVDGVARSALGFPRGEAVERSETDEEQRNVSITNAVRKKGTVFKSVPSDLTARYAERYRRSSSTPFGGTFPPGEGICSPNFNLSATFSEKTSKKTEPHNAAPHWYALYRFSREARY